MSGIAIKYTVIDIVVFDYIPFPIFTHTTGMTHFLDTLHVSDSLSVHHLEFKTVHTATGICQTDTAVCLLAGTHLVPASKQRVVSVSQIPVAVCTVLNS